MNASRLSKSFPTILAGTVGCAMTMLLARAIRSQTGGQFVYPLDDTYIHLALARTLAISHTWGLRASQFASASSSPAWTVMLAACDAIFGVHVWTPVAISLLLMVAVVYAAQVGLSWFAPRAPWWVRFGTPLVMVVGTPLPNLAIMGMEHLAQTLSIFVLLLAGVRVLTMEPTQAVERRMVWSLALAGAAAGALRYEAVFAVAPLVALLLVRRRLKAASWLCAGAALGPVLFALYSHHVSGFWLPYSVMVKVSHASPLRGRLIDLRMMTFSRHVTFPFAGLVLAIWVAGASRTNFWRPRQLLLLLAFVVSVGHLLMAPSGWLMRYESYLVCICIFALGVAAADAARGWAGVRVSNSPLRYALVAVIALGSLLSAQELNTRARRGMVEPVEAATDRYDEHMQMARFVGQAYDHDVIVLDDIGAVAYYTDAQILDMVGLGSVEPLLPRRAGRQFTADDMERWALTSGARIALLQDGSAESIQGWTPKSWIKVRQWEQPRNVVFGDLITSLYAITPSEVPALCDKLKTFELVKDDRVTFDSCPH